MGPGRTCEVRSLGLISRWTRDLDRDLNLGYGSALAQGASSQPLSWAEHSSFLLHMRGLVPEN